MSACEKHASVQEAGFIFCPRCEIESLIAENNSLCAENDALRNARLWWVTEPGNGLVRCVRDSRFRMFGPSIRARYQPVLIRENEEQRKDAERYRFVSKLAWYVDRAAQVYDLCNVNSNWHTERGSPDEDEVEEAVDAAMAKEAK